MKKIKSSNKVKRSKAAVTQSSPSHQQGEASIGLASSRIPTPDKLRQETERLLHIADRAKAGIDKIKSQRSGSVDVFISKRVRLYFS